MNSASANLLPPLWQIACRKFSAVVVRCASKTQTVLLIHTFGWIRGLYQYTGEAILYLYESDDAPR